MVRLRFLGKVLSVERASNKPTLDNKLQTSEARIESEVKDATLTKDLTHRSIPGSMLAAEPIAPSLGVEYPFPPHLE